MARHIVPGVTQRRIPFNPAHTALDEIPREWLRDIEPRVNRVGFNDCWIWEGPIDDNGYPYYTMLDPLVAGRRIKIMVHIQVARMFWNFPENYYVRHSCDVRNCIKPHHLYISFHHTKE